MIRKEAIKFIAQTVGKSPIIAANGYISRDLYEAKEKPSNFYMIGSMGLASSIGLGVALKKPKKRVFVFDGDGNILMNLGSLVTIGSIGPKNLVHIIFDNNSHESTGGQPTQSSTIAIDKIAKSTKYNVFKTNSKNGLEKILKKIMKKSGPIFILVKVNKSNKISKRVFFTPMKIKNRFMKAIQ